MMQTIDLITKLSNEAKPVKPMISPVKWVAFLLVICAIYASAAQIFLGIRADLATQFMRPLFAAEISLISLLFVSSIISATLNIYPDLYQKLRLTKLPYIILLLLSSLLIFQIFIPDSSSSLKYPDDHKIMCSACIALLSFIPAILIFVILKKGAATRPFQAGLFAVLAASSLGSLIFRLFEDNDSISHILTWHYLPMIFLALIGTLIGKLLLKW
ncbi:MAG: hypothetical protein ACJAZX_000509 [Rickettsiales bacterium]|jgi:hypothetical protein